MSHPVPSYVNQGTRSHLALARRPQVKRIFNEMTNNMQSLLTRRNCDSGSRSLNFKAAVLYCSWFPRCLPRKSNKPNCCMSFHDAHEETWAGRTCTHPICRLLSYSVAAASVMKRQLSRQDQQAGDHLLRRLPVLPNRRRCRL